ncbi:MAG TPA: FMN-binding protein [Streptosporangiaceae bacterium]|jgi:uncharacterized protein with FMN-binding domain
MKRAPALVAAGAITGFTGILIAHAGAGVPLAAGSHPLAAGPNGSAGPATSATPTAGSGSGSGKSNPARRHKSSGPAPGGGAHSVVGSTVNFGYGTIAVRVTVAGGRIASVSVARLSTLEPTSQQISSQAIPVLRSEVLAAQSVSINAVSGATYTSEGYARSVQAALDALHA